MTAIYTFDVFSSLDGPFVGLSSIGWTIVVVLAIVAWFALLVVAFFMMLSRDGLGSGGKIFWSFIILFLPYVGAIVSILIDVAKRPAD
jgi:hypothetical protein